MEQKQVELYVWDLLYLEAKRHYDGLKVPSDLYFKHREDKRNSKQIISDLINGLGGE